MSLRAAGFVIFRRCHEKTEYLLMQTSYGRHHWTPPKGHVDPGESDLETAIRETEEESGLKRSDYEVLDFKKVLSYPVKGKPKEVIYWLAKLINQSAVVKMSDEHQDYKWAELNNACALAEYSEMQDLLRECEEYIVSKKLM